ncbi:unnamed protein product [Durusdinium trenchii]|uniref:Uncharacterized protein n=1 Tax=Durusdinium trenchii TaxID=1381693 RepID=A0ABP0PBT9_9DINO
MSSQPAKCEQLQIPVANPYIIGDTILDGDEDAQVIVFECGAPTRWALQCRKWRNYFQVPDDDIEEDDIAIETSSPSNSSPARETVPTKEPSRGKKRIAEEAGLEFS